MVYCYIRSGLGFDVGYYTPAGVWVSKFNEIPTRLKAAQLTYNLEWGRPHKLPLSDKLIADAEGLSEKVTR